MKIKSYVLATIAIILSQITIALASDDKCNAGPESGWIPKDTIVQSLITDGYKVRKVEQEDGCYEVYAMKDGNKYELYINPKTGLVVKTKKK